MYNNMYDEDNIDLEEQMYIQDIMDEQDEQDEEDSDSNSKDKDDLDYTLNSKFLLSQLKLIEQEREVLNFYNIKTKKSYEGIVLGQSNMDTDKFVFSVAEVIEGKPGDSRSLKLLNINNLRKN